MSALGDVCYVAVGAEAGFLGNAVVLYMDRLEVFARLYGNVVTE